MKINLRNYNKNKFYLYNFKTKIHKMPFSFVANCLFLTYGPLLSIYSATKISEGIKHHFSTPL